MDLKTIKIKDKEIGGNNPTFIIAEISCNHMQNKNLALSLIADAKRAGADAVKFQLYTPDSITFNFTQSQSQSQSNSVLDNTTWKGRSLHSLYSETYTPREWFPELKAKAEELGLIFFASPFSEEEVDYLETLNVPCYKVASFEINHIPLIKRIAQTKKPVFISTGVATVEDIELAVKTIRKYHDKVILLKCTSAYPSPVNELNLKTIKDMSQRFNSLVGLSDHTTTIDSSILSIALGACVVEKHLKSNIVVLEGKVNHDEAFSLNYEHFNLLVSKIRESELALGKVTYMIGKENEKHIKLKRSIYVVKDIKKGEVLTKDNIKVIRPGFGCLPLHYEKVLGKKITEDMVAGTPLCLKKVLSSKEGVV